jgi:hypothetical protein
MKKLDFDTILPMLKKALNEALNEEPVEVSGKGPFGIRSMVFRFSNVFFELVLDRGDILLTLGPVNRKTDGYSFDFLHKMLFPLSRANIVELPRNEIAAVARWVTDSNAVPNWRCHRAAYVAFENCENLYRFELWRKTQK